jgi:hypothetical protein
VHQNLSTAGLRLVDEINGIIHDAQQILTSRVCAKNLFQMGIKSQLGAVFLLILLFFSPCEPESANDKYWKFPSAAWTSSHSLAAALIMCVTPASASISLFEATL